MAMAAFVAYKALLARSQANFKWLFVGDDDTLFFVEAAREVTGRLDPETAIFLTGAPLAGTLRSTCVRDCVYRSWPAGVVELACCNDTRAIHLNPLAPFKMHAKEC